MGRGESQGSDESGGKSMAMGREGGKTGRGADGLVVK